MSRDAIEQWKRKHDASTGAVRKNDEVIEHLQDESALRAAKKKNSDNQSIKKLKIVQFSKTDRPTQHACSFKCSILKEIP